MIEDQGSLDADPIDAIRGQLLGAAQSRSIQLRRRRQRRPLLAAALSTFALATGTAVAAVGGLSTGVPAIDRLLRVEGPSTGNLVDPGGSTGPIRLPLGSDSLSIVAYATTSSDVCVAQGVDRPGGGGQAEGGFGGCFLARSIAESLQSEGVVWATATTIGDHRLFVGYVDAAVADVRVRNAAFPTAVRMTSPWAPPGERPIRLLAIYDRAPGIAKENDDPRDDDISQLLIHNPEVEALDETGRPISRNK